MNEQDLALMSKGAYYSRDVARDLVKTIHSDWDVDNEFTTDQTTVYHHKPSKNTVVAFRGTKEPGDLVTDSLMFLGLGGKTKRFKEANELTKRVVEKYGKTNTSLTGHSLGSNIASDVSKKQDLPTTGFAKGRTLLP